MFPPPTTIAISRPSVCTSTISRAIASTRFGSIPYSWSPINASPESFSSTLRKAGAAPAGDRSVSACVVRGATALFCDREALEGDDTRACVGQRLAHRLRRVVNPGLLGERAARLCGEETLREHALDDLLLRLLRLALELVGVQVHLLLGLDRLGRDVLARRPLGRGERDVHRQLARERLVAALELHEHADLVRRRMGVGADDLAGAGLVALGADDDDVLAELAGEVDAVLLELGDRVRTVGDDSLEHLLREALELVVLGDRLGFGADGHHRSAPVLEPVADEPLGGRAAGPLGGLGHPALAQDRPGGVEVAVRLL